MGWGKDPEDTLVPLMHHILHIGRTGVEMFSLAPPAPLDTRMDGLWESCPGENSHSATPHVQSLFWSLSEQDVFLK